MKQLPTTCLVCLYLFCTHFSAGAADIYVNNVTGDDARDGLSGTVAAPTSGPLKSIAKAVAKAGPGDTIHLEPTGQDYHEEILFKDKGGDPGRPITVDGHGVTLNGAEPCPPGAWKKADGKLWCLEGISSRNALGVEDRIVLERKLAPELAPGQFCFESTQFESNILFIKAPADRSPKDCAVQVVWADGEKLDLDPNLWKIGSASRYKLSRPERPLRVLLDGVEAPFPKAKDRLEAGQWCMDGKDLFYYPPADKKPSEMNIRTILRGTGVSLAGKLGHVVIKNLNVRLIWNDAFNVHGEVVDATFLNCNASDCFDEGFSAHDRCETVLDGAVFERCDNGVFNVNEGGWSVTRNLTVRESRHYGFGVAVTDSEARHWLSNAVLENNPTPIFGRYLEADNVLVNGTVPAEISLAGPLHLTQATILGSSITLNILPGSGPVRLAGSVILSSGDQKVVFSKPAEVTMDSVFWSPQTSVILPKEKPMPVAAWIQILAGNAPKSGLLDLAPSAVVKDSSLLPKDVGYRKN